MTDKRPTAEEYATLGQLAAHLACDLEGTDTARQQLGAALVSAYAYAIFGAAGGHWRFLHIEGFVGRMRDAIAQLEALPFDGATMQARVDGHVRILKTAIAMQEGGEVP